ncbi:MAG: TraR/DksA family transcriptional regulator [Spirochaetales bacterium]
MEKEFIEKMKDSLFTCKDELMSQLMKNNEDFRQIVETMEAKDVIDIASDDIDRKMLEAVGTKQMNRLSLIDSALARIEQGKYGLCMKCGKRIPNERLEAIPYALLCIECQSQNEKQKKAL